MCMTRQQCLPIHQLRLYTWQTKLACSVINEIKCYLLHDTDLSSLNFSELVQNFILYQVMLVVYSYLCQFLLPTTSNWAFSVHKNAVRDWTWMNDIAQSKNISMSLGQRPSNWTTLYKITRSLLCLSGHLWEQFINSKTIIISQKSPKYEAPKYEQISEIHECILKIHPCVKTRSINTKNSFVTCMFLIFCHYALLIHKN